MKKRVIAVIMFLFPVFCYFVKAQDFSKFKDSITMAFIEYDRFLINENEIEFSSIG